MHLYFKIFLQWFTLGQALTERHFRIRTNLESARTWDVVPRPHVSHRLAIEMGPDGPMEHRKAHLVARGFTQKHGIDQETSDPVAYMTVVPILHVVDTSHR